MATLNAELNEILRLPEIRETLAAQGLATTGGTPEELGQLTAQDLERWAKVIRDAHIDPE